MLHIVGMVLEFFVFSMARILKLLDRLLLTSTERRVKIVWQKQRTKFAISTIGLGQ